MGDDFIVVTGSIVTNKKKVIVGEAPAKILKENVN